MQSLHSMPHMQYVKDLSTHAHTHTRTHALTSQFVHDFKDLGIRSRTPHGFLKTAHSKYCAPKATVLPGLQTALYLFCHMWLTLFLNSTWIQLMSTRGRALFEERDFLDSSL